MKKLTVIIFVLTVFRVSAHDQNNYHIHQHIVREAFKLLLLSYPELQNTDLSTYIGIDETNSNSMYKSWGDGTVVSGSWIEDEYDIVYHYGIWSAPEFNQTLTPELVQLFLSPETIRQVFVSITHFWDADGGLDKSTFLSDYASGIYWSYSCENAMQKMLKYFNGNFQNRCLSKNKMMWNQCSYVTTATDFSMKNIIDLYKQYGTIQIQATQHLGLNGWETNNCPNLFLQKKWIFEILGRMCHLLADMSVPAHVHCNSHAGTSGMYYDVYEKNVQNYHLWTANEIYAQGKTYLNPYQGWDSPLVYLMYYLNQITDHYASGKTNGDDNYDTNCPGLAEIFPTLGLPTSKTQINQSNLSSMHDVLFPLAIRATAGLLYWFAMETSILSNTTILNSFGGGKILANGINYLSEYHIPANSNGSYSIEAINQDYGVCYWRFQNWQKIVNGTVVQTFTTRNITITPTANTTYKANFTSDNYFNWRVTGPLKGLYRGESRVFNIYPFYGNPPANYYWHTKYRSIYNGQTYWTDGLPDGCSISFISNGTNTATFTNNYFSKYCGSWADSVIRVYGTVQPAGCGCSNQTFFEEITLKDRTRPGSPPPPPPPGGCPYVYTWNGNTWIEENNILPQSQDLTLLGQNVTDYYQLYTKPVEEDGKYYLAISEYEEDKSFFDQLKLLVIDHPEESFITIDDSGTVIQFAKPAFFANAQLDSNDVYKQLLSLDDIKTEVSESDVLSLSFEDVNSITENWLLLIGQVEAVAKEKVSAKMVSKNNNGKESSATFSSFRLRKNPTYQWVLAPTSSSSTLQIDIAWQEDAQVDYTELSNRLELPFILSEAELLSASHSALGDIKNEIMLSDGIVSELNKDEWIELAYSIPPIIQGMQRSFVLVSNGRYEHIIERYKYNVSGKNQLLKNNSGSSKPLEYRLEQNYPNPFNPASTINYSVKENGYVRLKVYDIIGNEVAELVNGNLDAGNYSVEFDAGGLPSGVYIYTIQVNNFFDSKKMILIK